LTLIKRFILLLIFTALGTGFAQEFQTITLPVAIDTVILTGNKHTKDYIILREIPFTFPDTLDEADFRLIQNRLQNLYLFNRIQFQILPSEKRNTLVIQVTEIWYFFPLPILFINEKDWGKVSYGAQISHFNFRGRNEKLMIGGWLGYNPSLFIRYFNPWIGKKSRVILGFSIFHNKIANKIFDFDESRTGASLSVGRKLTLNLEMQMEFSLQRIRLPGEYRQFSASGGGKDWMPTVSYQIKWDRRDLYEFPRKGFFLYYNLQRTGFTRRQPRFWRFKFDNRFYLPLTKNSSLGLRNLTIFQDGDLPIYDRAFFGYDERIRGYFKKVLPPTEMYREFPSPQLSLSSLEYRFPILPVFYFSWKDAPLFSALYRDLKFGISGTVFMDSGIVWEEKAQFALPNFYTGYGLGLNFHLPYIYLLRLEYAWSEKGVGQFIVDMEVSF